jgi:hypothetical protein
MKEVSRAVEKVVKANGGKGFQFSETDAEAHALWEGRKTALWSAIALLPGQTNLGSSVSSATRPKENDADVFVDPSALQTPNAGRRMSASQSRRCQR